MAAKNYFNNPHNHAIIFNRESLTLFMRPRYNLNMPLFYPTDVDYSGPLISAGADDVVLPHEREAFDRSAAGIVLDNNLRFLARADTLVGRAIGKALARLQQGDALMDLGYSAFRDYVHQRVGMSETLGYELARIERKLVKFPLIDAAFQDGRLSRSHVRLLLKNISPDEEAEWVARAEGLTVRRLDDALRERPKAPAAEPEGETAPAFEPPDSAVFADDELAPPAGRTVEFMATRLQAAKFDAALELGRRHAGANAPEAAIVELMAAEFLNAEGNDALNRAEGKWQPPLREEEDFAAIHAEREEKSRRQQRMVERAYNHWSHFDWRIPLVNVVPELDVPDNATAWEADQVVRKAVLLGQRVRAYMMRLLYTVSATGLRVDMGFLSLSHYGVERLGLAPRTVSGLVSLQRAFFYFPVVARAFYSGQLTQTQAEQVVQVAREETQGAWIAYARSVTAKQLCAEVKQARKQSGVAAPPPLGSTTGPVATIRPRAQMCAEQGGAASASGSQMCAEPGAAASATGQQMCAEQREVASVTDLQMCAEPGGAASASGSQMCAEPGKAAPATDQQMCAERGEAASAPGSQMSADPTQAPPPTDPQMCAKPAPASTWPPPRLSFHQLLAEALAARGGLATCERPTIKIRFWVPAELEALWERALAACFAIRRDAVSTAEALDMMVDAFLAEWGDEAIQEIKKHKLLNRDDWTCSCPVCRRRNNLHVHHVKFRSRGGGEEPTNLTTTCESDHQRGIHTGRTTVTGTAPDGLRWELGSRPDGPPHMIVENGRIVFVMEPEVRISAEDAPYTYRAPEHEDVRACA